MLATPPHFDVLIIGAGISGIGMAAHMQKKAPHHSYAILEQRANLGGTWDLFRYPGVRSDSDMHTLGFEFEPWRDENAIAGAPAILAYLARIVDERGIRPHIRFGHKVISADFCRNEAQWRVEIEQEGGTRTRLTARFLYLGSGYYDYDEPFDPGFDFGAFAGRVVHPQFWPEDLDHAGKQVVVIGSGATAVTLVPAMAKAAAQVTMLQRTPTWMFSRPSKDRIANTLRRILPEKLAYRLIRAKNIVMSDLGYKTARRNPQKIKDMITKQIEAALGKDYDRAAFTPPYDPWDQRVCLVPDADLFEAMKAGRASIVTGQIAAFEEGGVRLKDGAFLPADIVVTATGLKLAVAGKIAISVEGEPVRFHERFYYKGCMFSNLPNLAVVFGYLNASWTLRADLNADYICRVLEEMRARGAAIVTPVLTPEAEAAITEDDVFDFSSGYIQRGKAIMPRNSVAYPWRLNQEYVHDRKRMREDPVADGILAFAPPLAREESPETRLEAAE